MRNRKAGFIGLFIRDREHDLADQARGLQTVYAVIDGNLFVDISERAALIAAVVVASFVIAAASPGSSAIITSGQ